MRGLNIQELYNIHQFVQKHHSFGYTPAEERIKEKLSLLIKYIDNCYDTRTQTFWSIIFRLGNTGTCFAVNSFTASEDLKEIPYDNLFDWVMAYLKYEWEIPEKFLGQMIRII